MSSLRLGAMVLLVLGMGCGSFTGFPWPPGGDAGFSVCTSDLECSSNQVCYVDGCGDPGENLAVEVVPQQGTGEAQDFQIPPGNLRPQQILDLFPPSLLSGAIHRWSAAGPTPYSGRVSLSLRGESAVIPGLVRRYDTISNTDADSYQLQVGAGLYTLVARAEEDLSIPPVRLAGLLISPGDVLEVPVFFPGENEVVHLSGRIVRTLAEMDAVQAALELQVLDAETREPLSQRVPVASTGEFSVASAYPPSYASMVLLQVTPQDPTAQVPRRLFTVPLVSEPLPEPLEFGAYGSPVIVRGRLLDSSGQPVPGASVSLNGPVTGGGTYRSETVTSTEDGTFQLQTLAGDADLPMKLMISPPVESASALTLLEVQVPYTGGDLKDLTCANRVEVMGQVLRPDGITPAAGIKVTATPVAQLESFPLPSQGFETQTTADGLLVWKLDPALYRIDLSPGENLPRVSRFAAVRPALDDSGALLPVELPEFVLSSGRTVQGSVTIRTQSLDGGAPVAAPNATVRFFRVTPLEGMPGSLLLGETVSDASGAFQVVLPTR